jgi:Double zinc ribbon/Serine dehydrogenase proteinase
VSVPGTSPAEPLHIVSDEGPGHDSDGADQASPADAHILELQELLGYPVVVYYADSIVRAAAGDVDELMEQLGHQEELGLLLRSNGGDADAAHLVATVLHDHVDHLHIFVMGRAASAATLLALHADTLWMGPTSELGPIDPQIPLRPQELWGEIGADADAVERVWVPAGVVTDLLEFAGLIESDRERPGLSEAYRQELMASLTPWRLGWLARQEKISRLYAQEALLNHLLKGEQDAVDRVDRIVDGLSLGYASHRAGIMRRPAARLGLPVRDCDEDVWRLIRRLLRIYEAADNGEVEWILESETQLLQEQQLAWACPSCSAELAADASMRFCVTCGTELFKQCTECGRPIRDEWRFCGGCGSRTDAGQEHKEHR